MVFRPISQTIYHLQSNNIFLIRSDFVSKSDRNNLCQLATSGSLLIDRLYKSSLPSPSLNRTLVTPPI